MLFTIACQIMPPLLKRLNLAVRSFHVVVLG